MIDKELDTLLFKLCNRDTLRSLEYFQSIIYNANVVVELGELHEV